MYGYDYQDDCIVAIMQCRDEHVIEASLEFWYQCVQAHTITWTESCAHMHVHMVSVLCGCHMECKAPFCATLIQPVPQNIVVDSGRVTWKACVRSTDLDLRYSQTYKLAKALKVITLWQ